MLSGLKDVDQEILKHIDDKEILRVCSIDRKTWNEVCDDSFLRRRLMRYPEIEKYKKKNENWKQFFVRVVCYVSEMREEYKYESGDFKKQYNLLKRYKGNDLLVHSSRKGELSLVEFSLDKGADIHANEDDALRWASENGHIEIVKYLVERGANIHAMDDEALRYASRRGHLNIVKLLVEEHGADIHMNDDYALIAASANGYLEVVKYLVSKGADIHAQNDLSLRWAGNRQHLDVINYLIKHGAFVR